MFRFLEEGHASIPGARQVAGVAYDLTQYGAKVQTLVYAEAGLAQPGEAFSKRFNLYHKLLYALHTSPRVAACPGISARPSVWG